MIQIHHQHKLTLDQHLSKSMLFPQQLHNKQNRLLHNQSNQTIQFDWSTKWLKGQQYAYMLKNVDLYSQKYNFVKYPNKTHPQSIYTNPQSLPFQQLDGIIYFVEANSIGSEFGFPRVSIKKRYRWKKMNFTTDLPKKKPLVTYIVASAVKCERYLANSKNEGPLFRMHAVMIYKGDQKSLKLDNESQNTQRNLNKNMKNYVLCHIRKLDINQKGNIFIIEGEKKNKKNQIENQSNELLQHISQKFEVIQQVSEVADSSRSIFQQQSIDRSINKFFQANIDYFGLFKYLHNLNTHTKTICKL